jgi:hypothetical protein
VGVGTEDCFTVEVGPATKLKLVMRSSVDVGGSRTMLKVAETVAGEVRVADNPARVVELDEIAVMVGFKDILEAAPVLLNVFVETGIATLWLEV